METLKDVFERAVKSVESGDFDAALRDFVWLHDHPATDDPSSEMFRRAYGFLAWAGLGQLHPPAADKMRELLAQKLEHLWLHPDDKLVSADAGAMKGALETYD